MPVGAQTASFVALLRAVNVGGHGRLAMAELRQLCEKLGWLNVQTYVASGNVVFRSAQNPSDAALALSTALARLMGAPVGVFVRTAEEMREISEKNPFASAPSQHVYVFFLDAPPAADALAHAKGRAGEELALGAREIYVRYPKGMGVSKLRIPAVSKGTARNMNSVAKLAELAAG